VAGSTVLSQLLPQWALEGGNPGLMERLADRGIRARIARETIAGMAHRWTDLFISAVASEANRPVVGRHIQEIAEMRSREPIDAVLDLLAEEGGANSQISDHRWIIDPLDGTTNFAHSFPQFCVSIAYARRGRLHLGVVFDALKKEMFVAQRGKGARLNGKPIRVSRCAGLETSLLGTGFPYDRRERRRFYLAFWEAFMMRCQGVRRTGSAALDLCSVAAGRTDAFWEFGLKPWDVAAGALMVEEAGGYVTNMDGKPLDLEGARIVASNGRLHDQMIATILETYPEAERRQAEISPA